jgi:serine/threonine protein kinase
LLGLGVHRIPYKDLERVTNSFDEAAKLGAGGFGGVYKARWQHIDVAVKRLFVEAEGTTDAGRQVFLNEVRTLASLQHPNIVELMGYSGDGPSLCLVFPLAEHGSLYHRLRDKDYRILGVEG